MYMLNFYAVWVGIFLGFLAGAVIGLFSHGDDWLGGYSSWQRRMLRLGHISFFGIAIINLVYALSVVVFKISIDTNLPSYLFVAGAILMPTVCFLSAYKKNFRQLFPLPGAALVIGTIVFVYKGFIT